MNTSVCVYQGPSAINGSPIIAVLTGLVRPSKNEKTGHMAQLWILPAIWEDRQSVCGDCPFSGQGDTNEGCYVTTNARGGVLRSWRNGNVPTVEPGNVESRFTAIRLGAWGDPMALPFQTVKSLVDRFDDWTGYSHQWRNPRFRSDPWQDLVMASVESKKCAIEAWALGYRTFRVADPDDLQLQSSEILCPGVNGAQCTRCRLCRGNGRHAKNLVVPVHGTNFKLNRALKTVRAMARA